MSWLTVRYVSEFAPDLTSWVTTIERTGKLLQQVNAWPSRTIVKHRTRLPVGQVAELARLIAAIDLGVLADLRRRGAVIDSAHSTFIDVKNGGQLQGFCAPLLWWNRERRQENRVNLPNLDIDPILDLWRAVDKLSPRRHDNMSFVRPNGWDWRANIGLAMTELRRLRASGLSLDAALDHMRGRGLTLPAVNEALIAVEGMAHAELPFLFDARGDWDEF